MATSCERHTPMSSRHALKRAFSCADPLIREHGHPNSMVHTQPQTPPVTIRWVQRSRSYVSKDMQLIFDAWAHPETGTVTGRWAIVLINYAWPDPFVRSVMNRAYNDPDAHVTLSRVDYQTYQVELGIPVDTRLTDLTMLLAIEAYHLSNEPWVMWHYQHAYFNEYMEDPPVYESTETWMRDRIAAQGLAEIFHDATGVCPMLGTVGRAPNAIVASGPEAITSAVKIGLEWKEQGGCVTVVCSHLSKLWWMENTTFRVLTQAEANRARGLQAGLVLVTDASLGSFLLRNHVEFVCHVSRQTLDDYDAIALIANGDEAIAIRMIEAMQHSATWLRYLAWRNVSTVPRPTEFIRLQIPLGEELKTCQHMVDQLNKVAPYTENINAHYSWILIALVQFMTGCDWATKDLKLYVHAANPDAVDSDVADPDDATDPEPDNKCLVCLEDVEHKMWLECCHDICVPCAMRWGARAGSCPMCRHPIALRVAQPTSLRERVDLPKPIQKKFKALRWLVLERLRDKRVLVITRFESTAAFLESEGILAVPRTWFNVQTNAVYDALVVLDLGDTNTLSQLGIPVYQVVCPGTVDMVEDWSSPSKIIEKVWG